ncbi:hypothetical protein QL285_057163 [Trifolium repens]|nr:hypothetical protein QL285_057163 [Trifolium repens]
MSDCDLMDLGYLGEIYTWANNQADDFHIKERLDRFCANPDWINNFPNYRNYHLLRYSSDHNPIMLVFSTNYYDRSDKRTKHYIKRIEQIWLNDEDSTKVVQKAWQSCKEDDIQKLQSVLDDIHSWGKEKYGHIPRRIKYNQEKLRMLKERVPNKNTINQIKKTEQEMDDLLKNEELWWAQRAKAHWLLHGDKNTKYFHQEASQRKRKNNINFIEDKEGRRWLDEENIQRIFLNYFQDIFTSSNPSNIQNIVNVVHNRINDNMFEILNRPFSADEVYKAMKQLKSNAAPGPDGLNAGFYQRYWDIIGQDITNYTLSILNQEGNPANINHTHICLIPKHKQPKAPSDFRPIALCNVILKIVTKTIANRIKVILPSIISPHQSAFIPGRLISDNTLMALEVFHYIKHLKNKKKGCVGIKLDMAKAYDRIEWDFLKSTMLSMGFPHKLVNTIMLCVSTVSFSVLVNGQPSPILHPNRGIRQGDPLSPYLFILCADVLSSLIIKKQEEGLIQGIAIAVDAPKITHLFFADDSLIFCRARKEEATQLLEVLNEYQQASGQQINMNKSEMMFSPNLDNNIQDIFRNIITIPNTTNITKYLGLPTHIGRSKRQIFNFIMDKIWSKVKGWKENKLSFAGRGVLIRAVIQAIPTYIMSCFLVPQHICHQIEKAVCKFWWGGTDTQRKIHWKAKRELFKVKHEGGLGFRDIRLFNEALLAKQVWRLYTMPNSMLARTYKAKYFPNGNVLTASNGNNPSYAWRSICQAKETIKRGSCWNVGNGQNISIWSDHWVPHQNGFKILSHPSGTIRVDKVSDLIVGQPPKWNYDLIDQTFMSFEGELIKQIPLIREVQEDKVMWMHSRDGNYSVKTGYQALSRWRERRKEGPSDTTYQNKIWSRIWKIHTIPRHQTLLWRILNDTVPVRCELFKKGVHCSIICPRCNLREETITHTFGECSRITKVWFGSKLNINLSQGSSLSFKDWLRYAISNIQDDYTISYIASIIYNIWQARNQHIYDGIDVNEEDIINKAQKCLTEFQQTNQANPTYMADTINNNRINGVTPRDHNNHKQQKESKWKCPGQGMIKVNSDANLAQDGYWGLGAICRDNRGQILAAATWSMHGMADPVLAEAQALYNAMILAADCCFTQVVFESDCLQLITAIENTEADARTYLGNIVKGIKCNRRMFRDCNFSHTGRGGNRVAHALAQIAIQEPNSVWIEEAPSKIVHLSLLDLIL